MTDKESRIECLKIAKDVMLNQFGNVSPKDLFKLSEEIRAYTEGYEDVIYSSVVMDKYILKQENLRLKKENDKFKDDAYLIKTIVKYVAIAVVLAAITIIAVASTSTLLSK